MASRGQDGHPGRDVANNHPNDESTISKQSGDKMVAMTAMAATTTATTNKSQLPSARTQIGQQKSLFVQQQSITSSPSSTLQSCENVSFHLKSGIFTRLITIDSDKMALGLIKQLAIAFLDEIYFQHAYPSQTYIGDYLKKHFATSDSINQLYDRIILRLYDPAEDSFIPFYSVSDIKPNNYISIEISERSAQQVMRISPLTTTSVVVCSGDQGPPQSDIDHSTAATTGPTSGHLLQSNSHALSSSSSNYQLKLSHEFHSTTYMKPTYCASCDTLILGVYKQGFQCAHCKKNYCPKCKSKSELAGEGCLALGPARHLGATTPSSSSSTSTGSCLLSPKQQQLLQSPQSPSRQPHHHHHPLPGSQQPIVSNSSGDSGASSSSASSSISPNSQLGTTTANAKTCEKLEITSGGQHANMSKRKSASNLLHFNIANPFKSHHNNNNNNSQTSQEKHDNSQTRDESPAHVRAPSMKPVRGSTGALDPILQQLSKQMRDNQHQLKLVAAAAAEAELQAKNMGATNCNNDTTTTTSTTTTRLLNVQMTPQQLSSSHQNLYTISDRELETPSPGAGALSGSSSANQSPNKLSNNIKQLSNSARHSERNLSQAPSPTRRDQVSNHSFISMDWIQLYGEPSCGVCNKSLKTKSQPHQQPLSMCKTCKLQVHSQCQNLALAGCLTRVTESSRAAAATERGEPGQMLADKDEGDQQQPLGDKSALINTNSNVSRDNIRLHRLGQSVKHTKRPDSTKPIIEGWLQHKTLSDEQPRRHYWRLDETDITLYESDTSTRYFKAIALAKITRVISASSLPKQIKEDVALGCSPTRQQQHPPPQQGQTKSANASPLKTTEFRAQMESMFAFEVNTGSMYLVQASDQSEASRWKGSLEAITAKKRTIGVQSEKPQQQQQRQDENEPPVAPAQPNQHQHQFRPQQADVDKANEQQLQQAKKQEERDLINLSDKPQDQEHAAAADKQKTGRGHHHHHHHHNHHHQHHHHAHQQQQQNTSAATVAGRSQQQRSYTDPNRSRLYNRPRKVIKLDPMSIPDHWIEGKYLIERNRVKGIGFEELGSGQFGKVYAAVSEIKCEDPSKGLWSGVPVAIKEISKARFDLRQQAKLKNEANILSRLDHPGVIILERVHDLPDKLYIVMEQLEDDMLEMIVSTEEKRLNERVTKFLTYQILEALKYLHAQNIAHCDLKPENVLLCEQRSQFPQIKLCDFGFAKIIEENSFRSSLVGTPAYLAPEVVKGERYNRSVDLWSVGVIVYVSLSGEFPFNEGENIHDQISRANFMYPDQPWARISAQAKSFINSLLRVNCDKRLSASRAQMDAWLQDYQLWCDLCELELRLGRRWVTDDADFGRWSQYAKQRQLQLPRAAVQLHQELTSGDDED